MTAYRSTDIPPEFALAWKAYETEVKDRAGDQVEIERYVLSTNPREVTKLRRGGFKCCSPLRPDRHPSFEVYPDGRGWCDRATNEGGDLYSFAKKHAGLASHRDVIDHLAAAFGLPSWEERKKGIAMPGGGGIPDGDLETYMHELWGGTFVAEQIVFECATWLANVAASQLPDQVRAHLIEHYGLTDEFITLERVGYVTTGFWERVTEIFDCPYDRKTLLATGWFHESRSGRVWPTFVDRIVFIYWRGSQARYAIGRTWYGKAGEGAAAAWLQEHDWARAKYKKLTCHDPAHYPYVSPFVKNDVLWGEDSLRRVRGGTVTITEGVTDAMSLAMVGIPVISPVTVVLRNEDVARVVTLLKRAAPDRVLIANDNDTKVDARTGKERSPGLEGARRIAAALWANGIRSQILRLPRAEGSSKIDVNELCATWTREEIANP